MPTTLKFFRRNLPHWLVADRSYFVTLRLHGTLPKSVVKELQEERIRMEKFEVGSPELLEFRRKQFLRLEKFLDIAKSEFDWLSHPDVAEVVLDGLEWLRSKRGWRIYAAVVMSTHIHLLMRNEDGRSTELLDDLGSFKRYTGQKANELLGRSGRFWARESFDH